MTRVENFIGGAFAPAAGGANLEDLAPATGRPVATIPRSGREDVDAAVAAATRAFPAWRAMPAADRSRLLLRLAELIDSHAEELAQLESLDCGKPVALARKLDIPRAAANFRFFATAILHASTASHQTDDRALNYTLRHPLGVVGLISPWNLPLYLLTWKIAPAIAAGNCCVAKPSELTPLTAHRLAQLSLDAGIPPGVINIVHGLGPEAGEALTSHPGVAAISFTGGTKTGAAVARAAAPAFKKLSLELGGKNPNIVFADADLVEAVAGSINASFWNQGEICLCGSRILVERSAYDSFVERFVAAAKRLRIGNPADDATDIGALISAAHLEKVSGYVTIAKDEGARIATGGSRVSLDGDLRDGWFFEPTVITDVTPSCRVMQEEIFGPVVTVVPFDGADEAIAIANSTRYGLSASVWTRDLTKAHRVAAALEAGTVWVNCWLLRDLRVPFGGVKESGVGREGGWDSLDFFTEAKNVCIRIGT